MSIAAGCGKAPGPRSVRAAEAAPRTGIVARVLPPGDTTVTAPVICSGGYGFEGGAGPKCPPIVLPRADSTTATFMR